MLQISIRLYYFTRTVNKYSSVAETAFNFLSWLGQVLISTEWAQNRAKRRDKPDRDSSPRRPDLEEARWPQRHLVSCNLYFII